MSKKDILVDASKIPPYVETDQVLEEILAISVEFSLQFKQNHTPELSVLIFIPLNIVTRLLIVQ